jgi:hypothetical protein
VVMVELVLLRRRRRRRRNRHLCRCFRLRNDSKRILRIPSFL